MARRETGLAKIPTEPELAVWKSALQEDETALGWLKRRGITREASVDYGLGFSEGRVQVPVVQPTAQQSVYEVADVQAVDIDNERIQGMRGVGFRAFPWPDIESWDGSKPVAIVGNVLEVIALRAVGRNALCVTIPLRDFEPRMLPSEAFLQGAEIHVAMPATKSGASVAQEIASMLHSKDPSASIRLVKVPARQGTVGMFLGQAAKAAEEWDDLVLTSGYYDAPDSEGNSLFESQGRMWRPSRKKGDDPVRVADFTGTILEQGINVRAGEDVGRTWLFRLRHVTGATIEVRHTIGEDFRKELLSLAGSEWNIHARDTEDVVLFITRKTGTNYTTRHHGWVFGFKGKDFSRFYTPEVSFGDTECKRNTEIVMEPTGRFRKSLSLPLPDSTLTVAGIKLVWNQVLRCHHPGVTMPLIAATMLAPVRRLVAKRYEPYLVFLRGETGCGKTSRAKVFQSFFGDFWDNQSLLTFAGSTAFWLQSEVAAIGDCLVVIDELSKDKTNETQWKKIIAWLQSTPQGGTRERLTREGVSQAPAPVEHSTKLITCEHLPQGDQSLIARSLVVECPSICAIDDEWRVPHDEVYNYRHLLPQVMSSWLRWVMLNRTSATSMFEDFDREAKDYMLDLFDAELGDMWRTRSNIVRVHARLSMLTATLQLFLVFCKEAGGLTLGEADRFDEQWRLVTAGEMIQQAARALEDQGRSSDIANVIESSLSARTAALLDGTRDGHIVPSKASYSPSTPVIGAIRPVAKVRGTQKENQVIYNGQKVVVCLQSGVAKLWRDATSWTTIKNYLETARLATYVKNPTRYLLCSKPFAARILRAIQDQSLLDEMDLGDDPDLGESRSQTPIPF